MFVEREDRLVRSFENKNVTGDTWIEFVHVIGEFSDVNDAREVIHQVDFGFEVLQLFQSQLYERFGINAHPEQLAPYLDENGKLI